MVIFCTFTQGYMCQIDTALQSVKQVTWGIYVLCMNTAPKVKKDCQYDIKPQSHNLAYNLKRIPWVICFLAIEELYVSCLKSTYVKQPFQLVYLPNACEAYSLNTFILATVILTREDQNLHSDIALVSTLLTLMSLITVWCTYFN